MRSYPANSPNASARILAIAMLIDGHADLSEIQALQRHPALLDLGLTARQVDQIINELCHDLMISANHEWNMTVRMTPSTQQQILAEITDPVQQAHLLALCEDLIAADGQQHPAESVFIDHLQHHWQPIPAWQLAARTALRAANTLRQASAKQRA
ncbi:MAG: hypothetical protein PHT48_08640 [Dechloromonas sp.]|nr:hypothetical protein [Dechloromonas sp.]